MLEKLKDWFKGYFTNHRIRDWKENITGYLMIAPSVILIFLFGIMPVGFALYVSVHKWRLKQGRFLGVDNYLNAIGNVTFVVMFFMALGAIVAAYLIIKKIIPEIKENGFKAWLMSIPGFLYFATIALFLRYIWFQLPEFLGIADKLIGQEKTQELFSRLMKESFEVPVVSAAWSYFLWTLIIAILVNIAFNYFFKNTENGKFISKFMLFWTALITGIALIYFTFQEVFRVYEEAMETGTDPGVWPQVITITSGVILLALGWNTWKGANKNTSNLQFFLRLIGATSLLIGAWIMIGEIPIVIASGDKDLWNGLKVTVFFSLGTVPFQLSISMFLAVLLFQKLKGSEFFRMVFFLPYVTPFIASAAIFRQLFANRDTALINLLLRSLGMEPQSWLQESKGVFSILAESMNFSIPDWATGPSLALAVIIIHSVWTYVGYNTVIYLAGLGNISTDVKEAAEIDGANKWEVFRFVTFPLLSPTTFFLSLIGIIGTFKAFATLWVFRESLALGTANTFSVAIFIEFFEKLRYGYASALAFVLFGIILILTYVNNKVQGSRVFYG
jgi:multiple sugar transport system permease protein